MPAINDEQLRSIHYNASSLEERYGEELAKGEIPEGLSLVQISQWDKSLFADLPGIKKRLEWFKGNSAKSVLNARNFQKENKKLNGWIAILKKVFGLYSNLKASNEGQDQFAIEDDQIPFGNILTPWVQYFSKRNDILYFHLNIKIRKEFEHALLKDLSKIAAPSILSFYTSFLKKNRPTSRDAYKTFSNHFLINSYIDFYTEYAALARQMVKKILQWERGIKLLFDRLERDKSQLALLSSNGNKLGKLIHVETNLSTPHSVDGQVCILHFEGGLKWVYKPRSCAPDRVLNRLVIWLNSTGILPELRTAKILDKGQYFWQEFIDKEACSHVDEFSEYYERIGCLGALFLVLGSTDYHFGNLRAHGAYPILIDNETLFSSRIKLHQDFSISGEPLLDSSLFHSIAQGQFLLDSALSFFPYAHAISGAFHQVDFLPIHKFTNLHSSEMVLEEEKMRIFGQNRPFTGSHEAKPTEYAEAIIDGFTKCLQVIIQEEKAFYALLKSCTRNYTIPYRLLLKPSAYYHAILLESKLPEYNKDGVTRSLHFEQLASSYLKSNDYRKLHAHYDQELKGVENDFIPWFHVNLSEKRLHVDQDTFADSPLIRSNALEIILQRRENLMNGSLYQLNLKMLAYYLRPHQRISKDLLPEIYHLLFCYQHHFDFKSFEANLISSPRSFIENLSIGKGIFGVLLVFGAWFKIYRQEAFKVFLDKVLALVFDAINSLPFIQLDEKSDIGVVNGLGSVILGFYHLRDIVDEGNLVQSMHSLLTKFGLSKIKDRSFGRGKAGFVYALSLIGKFVPKCKVDVDQNLQELIGDLKVNLDSPEFGIVDGLAGHILALCAVSVYNEDDSYLPIINKKISLLRSFFQKRKVNLDHSLFHGIGGYLIVETYLKQLKLERLIDVRLLVDSLSNLSTISTLPDYLSLGNAGIAESMMLNETFSAEQTIRWFEVWESRYKKEGRYSLKPKYLNPSFYNGISGIIYTKLRFHYPEKLPFIWPMI